MAIVLSILCAAVYGASDFCGGLASRRTPTLGVVVGSQAVGLVLLAALAPFVGGAPQASDWWWGAATGVAAASALLLLYRGLAIGTMAIVSPVTATLAAIVPIAYGVTLRGERLGIVTTVGILAALVAVILISIPPGAPVADRARPRGLPPGVLEAVGAGVSFGAIFITIAQTHAASGLGPLAVARCATMLFAILVALALRTTDGLRIARPAYRTVALCGLLDALAVTLYLLAVHSGAIAIVAVISSLYPASTVALAALVFGERLAASQWIGVVLALAGVATISAAR